MATVATGGSTHGSREARRRRILERGSDRLALITGRIQSLPPDPDPDPDQSPSSTFQTPADSAQQEDAAPNSSLPNQESSREQEPQKQHIFDETIEPLLQNINRGGSVRPRSVALDDTKEQLSQISSTTGTPAQERPREQGHRNSLTSGQISSAISASENIRMCCSVVAATLVILSYIGFPILGLWCIRGVIIFRPVYLLLLTNISIVVGRVILGIQGAESRTRRSSGRMVGGNSSLDQLGKALEVGLMLQNIVRAVFMDFSIYAIVLISGLSLIRGFGL